MFILLTNKDSYKVFVRKASIVGLIQRQGYTKVFLKGDLTPYEVKETAEEIIHLIDGVDIA